MSSQAPEESKPRFRLPNQPYLLGFVAALGLLAAWRLVTGLVHITDELVLIVMALILALGLNRFVDRLVGRGMTRRWAVVTVAITAVVLFAGFLIVIAQPLANQTTELIDHLPRSLQQLTKNPTIRRLDDKYHIVKKIQTAVTSQGSSLAGGVVGIGKYVITTIFKAFTVLVLIVYFLGSLPTMKSTAYRLVPRSRRQRVAQLTEAVLARMGGYVSGAMVVALCAGAASWIMLAAIGAPYALPLALLVALTDVVPLVGALVGAAITTGTVLLSSGGQAIACAVFFIAYQQLENYFIYPRVMSRSVDVPAAVAVVAALIGGALFGVIGALIALPIAAGGLHIVREVFLPRQDSIRALPESRRQPD